VYDPSSLGEAEESFMDGPSTNDRHLFAVAWDGLNNRRDRLHSACAGILSAMKEVEARQLVGRNTCFVLGSILGLFAILGSATDWFDVAFLLWAGALLVVAGVGYEAAWIETSKLRRRIEDRLRQAGFKDQSHADDG
jgi:hypothetical protein